jgi:phenylalanyl-tRNA synthetase beta subunit
MEKFNVTLTLQIDDKMNRQLTKLAHRQNSSKSFLVLEALQLYLRQTEHENDIVNAFNKGGQNKKQNKINMAFLGELRAKNKRLSEEEVQADVEKAIKAVRKSAQKK